MTIHTLKLSFAIPFFYLTKCSTKLVVPSQEKSRGRSHSIKVRARVTVRGRVRVRLGLRLVVV